MLKYLMGASMSSWGSTPSRQFTRTAYVGLPWASAPCEKGRTPHSVQNLADKTLSVYGQVNVVCNNAGIGGGFGKIWESSLKDWQWALNVNLWGVIHGVRTFVPIMLEQSQDGHVVNTASVAGLTPGTRVYSVTKHAVVALSEALYHNLRQVDARIGASVLCPGLIDTQKSPRHGCLGLFAGRSDLIYPRLMRLTSNTPPRIHWPVSWTRSPRRMLRPYEPAVISAVIRRPVAWSRTISVALR